MFLRVAVSFERVRADLLGAFGFSFFTFYNGICWAQVGMLTAQNIHAELLKSVLAGRMQFFDTTPVIDTVPFGDR